MALPHYQYNGEALILKSRRHGEADLILTLLTADLGKFDVLARGARKAKSRKSGHVEPFVLASFSLRRSKWLPEVAEAQIQDAFPLCRSSLEKVTQASYTCELIDSLTQPRDPGELSQVPVRLAVLCPVYLESGRNSLISAVALVRIAGPYSDRLPSRTAILHRMQTRGRAQSLLFQPVARWHIMSGLWALH